MNSSSRIPDFSCTRVHVFSYLCYMVFSYVYFFPQRNPNIEVLCAAESPCVQGQHSKEIAEQ